MLKRGDITRVKLLSIDEKGRLRLSRKAALAEEVEGSSTDRAEGEDNIEVIEDCSSMAITWGELVNSPIWMFHPALHQA